MACVFFGGSWWEVLACREPLRALLYRSCYVHMQGAALCVVGGGMLAVRGESVWFNGFISLL